MNYENMIQKIVLPTRPQPDTLVAIFLLQQFGESQYPGVSTANVTTNPSAAEEAGVLLLDVGGGELDHHGTDKCVSEIVAKKLNVEKDQAIRKLLTYARRDDMEGKGTLSKDPIDRAFGLSGLIASLNKQYPTEAPAVVAAVLPLLKAHYINADEHYNKFPKLIQDLEQTKLFSTHTVHNEHVGKLKVAFVSSDHTGLAGFLRSQTGGNYRVVVQRRPSGHVNIITKQNPKLDLSYLMAMLRMQELAVRQQEVSDESTLYQTGTHPEVPNWYYDPATNSLLNGGMTPDAIEPTQLRWSDIEKIVLHSLATAKPAT